MLPVTINRQVEAFIRCTLDYKETGVAYDEFIDRVHPQLGPPVSPDVETGMRFTVYGLSFFTLVTGPRRSLSLKLCDARVYKPQIRVKG